MIEKIKISSVNINNKPQQQGEGLCQNAPKQPSFGNNAIIDGLIKGVQLCEKHPMVNVTALDLTTAIVPRTYYESKEAGNTHAGFEAFRRESSGLLVNCIIPSAFALGAAKLIQRPIMGEFGKASLVKSWAGSDTLDVIHKEFAATKGVGREKVEKYFENIYNKLVGIDGDISKGGEKKFSGLLTQEEIIKIAKEDADRVFDTKFDAKLIKKSYESLAKKTNIAEHIKFIGEEKFLPTNLESLHKESIKVIREAVKAEIIDDSEKVSAYFKNAKKLVGRKSAIGLAIIIPLAVAMQPINRWITSKNSGVKGAPIYKDYENSEYKEPTSEDKAKLLKQKVISIASMVGVAMLSLMKPLSARMFEFKGLFPTMDQARLISTATFASRMAAADDDKELKSTTIRDIATFASFYFLGDYVSKGIATIMEKCNPDKVKLLNVIKAQKEDSNIVKNVWNKTVHWVKHTSLKSSDEIATVGNRNLRTICQLGNIAFSLLSLGIFIPKYTISQANKKKQAEEKARQDAETQILPAEAANATESSTTTSLHKTRGSSYDFSKSLVKDSTAFEAFFNS